METEVGVDGGAAEEAVGARGQVLMLIQAWASGRSVRLPVGWQARIPSSVGLQDVDLVARVSDALGWDIPVRLKRKPRAEEFPLLLCGPDTGWEVALRWRLAGVLGVVGVGGARDVPWTRKTELWSLAVPADLRNRVEEPAARVFWRAVLERPRMLVEATLATVVVNILALVTSVYSMQVYDRVIPLKGYSTLTVLTVGMLFAVMLDFALRNVRAAIVDRETEEIDSEISEFFFERMQAVRMDSRPAGVGTMAGQLRGLEQVRSAMTSASMFALADLPFALIFMGFMSMIGGVLSLVPLVFFPISILFAVLFARAIRDATAQAQISGNHKNGLLVEALDASETLKSSGGDWFMLQAWSRLVEQVHVHDRKIRRWSTIASTTFASLPQVAYVIIVFWGTYLVAENTMTMGQLIACTIVSGRITGPLVSALPSMIIQWGYARQSLQSLDKILAMPSVAPFGRQMVSLSRVEGEVRLEDASFSYPRAQPAVHAISMTVGAGERIGIIGAVGSGKSTLLRMLGGLYVPSQGVALLDRVDMAQVVEADLRRHVCYLPQNYRLVGGTLRDNLTFGLTDASDERLLEAAGRTGLGDLIRKHPQGLDMSIAEGGRGLSGGQASLVGLTRILLLKPKVVLLDEPTAALDQDNEARALQAIFSTLGETSTIVIVTHKIQLLSLVRRLIVMANGKIALDGPTQSVIERLRAPMVGGAGPRPAAAEEARKS